MEILKIITISDLVTILNLTFGLLAIYFNEPNFIYIAVIFDALDGYVARKTKTVTEFGKELDSLSDIVSFGVATSYFLAKVSIFIAIIYCIAGSLRLARFNIVNSKDFIGLPIPAGSLFIIASLQLFKNPHIIIFLSLLVSYLMVSDIKFKKVRDLRVGLLVFISIILAILNHPEPIFIIILLYIGYSLYRRE
ncbi:CDP-diacylglycerol/serine O-phosphatidyltransferase [Methanocaldococcus infernus ME]|uniref:CDP-diacylglycerol--serine O-phosphatidyltransferase n=1 Tax=Methanocaldococcus infernus (strain DSM 11812 / JCM 15783 / ME) TaxID=573063 RepID=D5VRD6_METIM|nr:CDP-diacylglycerol--serine O-phosphatidyltransferase [Methanocaldococcus infernus]ADG13139.1 CDP-diacylglycerol/serine O-phosphatidyltransferase [Methanocaldococcus infernus ME]